MTEVFEIKKHIIICVLKLVILREKMSSLLIMAFNLCDILDKK